MKTLFSIFLLLCLKTIFGQFHIIPELNKICPINLQDPVEKVPNLFICSDAMHIRSTNSQKPPCRLYRYLPAKSHPVSFGKANFENVSVLVNEKALIKSIDFTKWYNPTDSLDIYEQLKNDCNNLVGFFESYYMESKKKEKVYESANLDMETYVWQRDEYKIIVQKEIFKKDHAKAKSVLVLTISSK